MRPSLVQAQIAVKKMGSCDNESVIYAENGHKRVHAAMWAASNREKDYIYGVVAEAVSKQELTLPELAETHLHNLSI